MVPEKELDRWIEYAGEPVWEQWVNEREKAGDSDARKVLDRTLELIETYHPDPKVTLP
jgi:hypothetical protein